MTSFIAGSTSAGARVGVSRREFLSGTAVSIGAMSLSGETLAQVPVGKTLRMVAPEPVMLTGAFNSAGQIYLISGKIFDGLVTYDFQFNPRPQLALSWEISADGLTTTFKLRPNVKWHDGTPFTSADLAYSALNVWKVAHPRGRSVYANLVAVDTPDPLTAALRFSKPCPTLMNALAGVESQILPRHLYEGKELSSNPANLAPIGTGPFRFVEWKRGERVVLERFADYWNPGQPKIDRIVIRFIPDAGARSAAFEAGELDIGGDLPVALADAKRLGGLPSLLITEKGSEALATLSYIEFNLRKPPFNDVRVRRAVAHAIDRAFIIRNVWYGFGRPATGPLSRDMSQFYTDQVRSYSYDIAEAQRLLDEAGHPRKSDGIRFRITHDPLPTSDAFTGTADYFRAALQRIGIAVEIRNQDIATFYKRVYGDYDFDTTNFAAFNLTDPTLGVQRFYWSKNIIPGVAFSNGSGYSNPDVDALLESAQVEIDPVKRKADYARFQQIVMEDLPNIPIGDINWFTLQSRKVDGFVTGPYGVHDNFGALTLS